MTLRAGFILVGLGAALLSGCGGQDPTPTAASPSMKPAKIGSDTPTESPRAQKREPQESTEPDEATDLVGFTSPSGNVGCIIDSTYVRCDIAERDWSPPPGPPTASSIMARAFRCRAASRRGSSALATPLWAAATHWLMASR